MAFKVPDNWLTEGVKPDDLSEHTIKSDKWDEEDRIQRLIDVPDFAAARETLGEAVETGEPAMDDAFWTLLKADPQVKDHDEIKPSHLINGAVMAEALELNEMARLRRFSVNDDVQAALSSAEIEPDLETLFDRLRQEQQKAKELGETLAALAAAMQSEGDAEHDLDEMVAKMKAIAEGQQPGDGEGEQGEGDGDPNGDGLTDEQREQLEAAAKAAQDAAEARKELQDQAQGQASELEQAMEDVQPKIQVDLRAMLEKAAQTAQATADAAAAWGLDPGTLQRMSAEERFELAKKLQSPRFKHIADLFGPMRNLMLSEQQRKTHHIKEEIYDVELGADISRLLPSEYLGIRHRLLRLDFRRKFAMRQLLQYAMQGTERLARGGIIFCEDGSGSMSGEREMWSKAVMLCLLDLARRQKRTMHVIHFGSPGQFQIISFTKAEDFTFDRIVDAAELFFGGGTDFQTPMVEALKILDSEFSATGGVKADVVFMTDDECWVQEEFMAHYLEEMERMDATTWGISATGYPVNPEGMLSRMCEGKTATVADFMSGNDIRNVFRGV